MPSLAESAIRTFVKSVGARRYDHRHKIDALRAVGAIETYNGTRLTQAIKKRADDYAVEVLGTQAYAPWLYVYALVTGEFREGWIPDNFFGRCVFPRVNNGLGLFTHCKTLTNVVLKTNSLPDIAYRIDGVTYDRSFRPIGIGDLRALVGGVTHLFVKQDGSARGVGVVKLAVGDLSEDALGHLGNCVIQLPIRQHGFFDEIIPGAVATLRITTVKDNDGRIELRASYLRLGRADTEWVQSGNSVRVAIVDRAGVLDAVGYTQDWRRWSAHPDSHVGFAGKRIPCFEQAVQTCVALHAAVPHFAIIGWDVAIDDGERVKIIEWNGGHCDIKFSEAATGPCFVGLGWERLRDRDPDLLDRGR